MEFCQYHLTHGVMVLCVLLSTHVVITQWGVCPLILAARWGRTEVVSLLVKAGAALDLSDRVNVWYSSHHSVMLCVIQTQHVLLLLVRLSM